MKTPLIAASILSADFSRLGEDVGAALKAGADWVHVDVMDGHFVPNITIGPVVLESLHRALPQALLDVHLMITEPEKYVEAFAKAGARYISVHQETCPHLHKVVQQIRQTGALPAVVLNPATPVSTLVHILPEIDLVLLMSVNPGFGGQKFIPDVLAKVQELAKLREAKGLKFLIEVDGGVNENTAADLKKAGADVLVAGNAIFRQANYSQAISALRNA